MSLTVDLTPDELQTLTALARRAGRSTTDYAHSALTSFLAEESDDLAWAAKVKAAWDASDKKTRPASELRAELGL